MLNLFEPHDRMVTCLLPKASNACLNETDRIGCKQKEMNAQMDRCLSIYCYAMLINHINSQSNKHNVNFENIISTTHHSNTILIGNKIRPLVNLCIRQIKTKRKVSRICYMRIHMILTIIKPHLRIIH